jgi:hypothetical protein
MITAIDKTSTGQYCEIIKYTVPRPTMIDQADVMNRNNCCSMSLQVTAKGTEDGFQALGINARQGTTIKKGSTSYPGDSMIFRGPLLLDPGEELWALFVYTDAGDKLALNLKVRPA